MSIAKFKIVLAVLVCCTSAANLCAEQGNKSSRKLKVGVIAPFSGSAHIYGDAVKNGINMALEKLKSPQIEVIFEDDQFSASKTVTAFRKLVEEDKVDLVLSVASTPSNAVAPIAEQFGVPLIAWASDRKVSHNRKFVIRSYMSGYEEGKTIADEAKRRALTSVATVISANDYTESVLEGFLANFPKDQLVLNQEFLPETDDFRSFVAKARSANVKAFFVCLNPGGTATFAKQAREHGLQASFFGCENLHDLDVIRNSNGALVGAWLASVSVSEVFRQAYMQRFKQDSIIAGAAVHYDLVFMLNDLLARWRAGEKLIDLLMNVGERKGVIGNYTPVKDDSDQYYRMKLVVKEAGLDGFKVIG